MKKLIASILAVILTAYAFTACSLDDADETLGNNEIQNAHDETENIITPESKSDAANETEMIDGTAHKDNPVVYDFGEWILQPPAKSHKQKYRINEFKFITDLNNEAVDQTSLCIDNSELNEIFTYSERDGYQLTNEYCMLLVDCDVLVELDPDQVLEDESLWISGGIFPIDNLTDNSIDEINGCYGTVSYVDYEQLEGYTRNSDPRMSLYVDINSNEPFPITFGIVYEKNKIQDFINSGSDLFFLVNFHNEDYSDYVETTWFLVKIPKEIFIF